jgi:hypothetical protein
MQGLLVQTHGALELIVIGAHNRAAEVQQNLEPLRFALRCNLLANNEHGDSVAVM